jgi:predicted nucleic acid-binding protein
MKADRIFVDTNLFLRYLTNDVAEQADVFEQILRQAAAGDLTLVTNNLVIAEIVWTLESYYHVSPSEVQDKILAILNTPGLEVVDGELVLQAVLWHVEKSVDFIDAFNVAWMIAQEVKTIITFDRKHFNRFEEIVVTVPGETLSG